MNIYITLRSSAHTVETPRHPTQAADNGEGYKLLHDFMAQRLAQLRQRAPASGGGSVSRRVS